MSQVTVDPVVGDVQLPIPAEAVEVMIWKLQKNRPALTCWPKPKSAGGLLEQKSSGTNERLKVTWNLA